MEDPFAETFKEQMKYLWTSQIPGLNPVYFLVSYNRDQIVWKPSENRVKLTQCYVSLHRDDVIDC